VQPCELEEFDQLADLLAVLGRMAHLCLLVDDVTVPAAVPLALHRSCLDQVNEDPLRGSLGDPDVGGDVPEADIRVSCDAKENLGVVGEEPPARSFVI
jgi:hypothetical protein